MYRPAVTCVVARTGRAAGGRAVRVTGLLTLARASCHAALSARRRLRLLAADVVQRAAGVRARRQAVALLPATALLGLFVSLGRPLDALLAGLALLSLLQQPLAGERAGGRRAVTLRATDPPQDHRTTTGPRELPAETPLQQPLASAARDTATTRGGLGLKL